MLAIAAFLASCAPAPPQQVHQLLEPPAGSYVPTQVQITLEGVSESLPAVEVSADFFGATQARPLVGRFFIEGDFRAGTQSVVVLGHDFWQQRFHASPRAVGTGVPLNGRTATIVGIAEREFKLPQGAVLWVPKRSE